MTDYCNQDINEKPVPKWIGATLAGLYVALVCGVMYQVFVIVCRTIADNAR